MNTHFESRSLFLSVLLVAYITYQEGVFSLSVDHMLVFFFLSYSHVILTHNTIYFSRLPFFLVKAICAMSYCTFKILLHFSSTKQNNVESKLSWILQGFWLLPLEYKIIKHFPLKLFYFPRKKQYQKWRTWNFK